MKILAASLLLALGCVAAEDAKPVAPAAKAEATAPVEIFSPKENGYAGFRNPACVLDERDGSITVLLTWKIDGAHEGDIRKGKQAPAMIWSVRSTDGGKTWSKAEERKELSTELLARGWRWNIPGPGRAIQLQNGEHKGRLVVAANHSGSGGEGNRFLGGNSFLSDDGGKTWKLGAVDAAPAEGRPAKGDFVYPNESTCAELPDGRIVFSTRD